MQSFSQTVVKVRGVPDVLHPVLYKSSKDFSAAVDGAVARSRDLSPTLGISILLTTEDAFLEAVAVATSSDEIFVLYSRTSPMLEGPRDPAAEVDTLSPLLRGQKALLVGFGMSRIAMHIRHGLNSHVRGIELAEAASPKERHLSPGAFVKNHVDPNTKTFGVDTLWDALPADLGNEFSRLEHLALRAWLTARVSASAEIQQGLNKCTLADTLYLSSKYYKPIHQMLIEVEQMEAAKSRVQENDFKGTALDENGHVIISNDRFSNRVRPSERTEVWMIDEANGLHRGTARRAIGKQTHVAPRSNLGGISLKAIFVVGKDDFSHADRARETFLLRLLQGKHDLQDPGYELIHRFYFPNPNETMPRKVSGALAVGKLNQSQADVVEAMVNSEEPFVVVHGPPGTGKTSTISAAVQSWIQIRSTVWVVAQSNVAVKNIAERLSKDLVSYRLLVSKEFYHEWHEHIYDERVKESLIRTDELPAGMQDVAVVFNKVNVVLCTLGTLSNPALDAKNIFSFVPVINLVVDEASQIGIFNYMHVFALFKRLTKICFFGDPKQLPPFGKEVAVTLQSVFDVRHLKPQAYFLNTQYRMPVPLGSFISDVVYNGKLRSEHKITAFSCVAFIDVSFGEEKNDKKSYINEREVQTVEHLVRYYYNHKDYCIVTPYDAQRNLLQKTLEAAGLRSDNIYNVDSFQGNEADFIIVSVVRSTSPGFLNSKNRVNVMLTRCRLGMVIVSSRAFMQQRNVKETLLGGLQQYWENAYGQENTWRDWRAVAGKKADLPGVDGTASRAESHSGKNYASASRTSTRAPISSESVGCRRLAPVSARLSGPSTQLGIISGTQRLREIKAKPSPTSSSKASIDLVTRELQRTQLDTTFPRLPSAESRARVPRSQESNTSNRNNPRIAYSPSLGAPAATRSQPVTGAWRNGPPTRLPSQKLTPLRKYVPSEMLAPTQKKTKKLERLML